ncbi:MAG: sulfatase [Verrucomicrobiales bacterium]|jgi:arylsulfatase A-like enzyme|nr:sulfatase [Verrucomicrobiales bacterium]
MKLLKIGITLLLAAVGIASGSPNVVLFLVDDLGWMDLGCQGSKYYQTPNIDALAKSGVRFTNAYAACAVCSPTRAAILTGKYPARLMLTQWLPAGRWNAQKNRRREGRFVRSLPLEEITIAEALRDAGYTTWHIGKWHLGGTPFSLPQHHGFNVNIAGDDHGAPGSYFYPFKGTWRIPTTPHKASKQAFNGGKEGDYLTDVLSAAAVNLIRKHDQEKPFFLYFPFYNVHTPLQGKKDKVDRYAAIPKSKRQGTPDYAAMVESVDEGVGKVMASLRELNLLENTLVIFTSDNGGFAKATTHGPLRANKGSHYEGGIRVPLIMAGAGVLNPDRTSTIPATSSDLYPTILETTGLSPKPHQHLDGISLTGILTKKASPDRKSIFWHYPHYNRHPSSAPVSIIRQGPWKLIEFLETDTIELYNLAADLGESKDLANAQPKRAAELRAELHAWKTTVGADPMKPNPEYQAP